MRPVIFWSLIILASFPNSLLNAQERNAGLLISEDKYNQLPILPSYSGVKYNEIPLKHSLKAYCPVAGDQGEMGSCAAWAVGYGALSLSRALLAGETDQAKITLNANSAAFIHNQIKMPEDNCKQGTYIEDALRLLLTQGDCREETFNFSEADCYTDPGDIAKQEAEQYRIQDYAIVFDQREETKAKIAKICKVLAADHPVIVGLQTTTSFWDILPGDRIWRPKANERSLGHHAMLLVGYDNVEKQFELLNSFGPAWANSGYIKMSFEDFDRLCQHAYVLLLNQSQQDFTVVKTELNSKAKPKGKALNGEFVFRKPAGYLVKSDGSEIPFFEEVPTIWSEKEQLYQTRQTYFEVGDAFQLIARQLPKGEYVYVFSRDANGQVNLHFPKVNGKRREADFALSENVEIIIPSEETVLQLTNPGNDYLCIIYSGKKIENIEDRLENLDSSLAFPQAVEQAFNEFLIPESLLQRDQNKMAFSAFTQPKENKFITSIILKVIAQ